MLIRHSKRVLVGYLLSWDLCQDFTFQRILRLYLKNYDHGLEFIAQIRTNTDLTALLRFQGVRHAHLTNIKIIFVVYFSSCL